jgi:hypothetical protein
VEKCIEDLLQSVELVESVETSSLGKIRQVKYTFTFLFIVLALLYLLFILNNIIPSIYILIVFIHILTDGALLPMSEDNFIAEDISYNSEISIDESANQSNVTRLRTQQMDGDIEQGKNIVILVNIKHNIGVLTPGERIVRNRNNFLSD